MWDTLGLWLGPAVAVVVAAIGSKWFGWFRPRLRRRVALQRIAEKLAYDASSGYEWQRERYLEHYLGGRDWHDEIDKMDSRRGDYDYYDSRGPALAWWQRLLQRLLQLG